MRGLHFGKKAKNSKTPKAKHKEKANNTKLKLKRKQKTQQNIFKNTKSNTKSTNIIKRNNPSGGEESGQTESLPPAPKGALRVKKPPAVTGIEKASERER